MIVVFGSINLDLTARVPHLPRAGETQLGSVFSASAGGKGANQALAARRAGATVALHGAVGRDAFADSALALLRQDGVDIDGVKTLDAPTGVALIHVDDNGQNTITVIPGANGFVDAAWVPPSALGPASIVLMQLETPRAEVTALAKRTRAGGGRVILNAAPAQALAAEILSLVDVLIVNESEAAALAPSSSPLEFATAFAARFGTAAVVTLGANGLLAASIGTPLRLPAPKVAVVDTVGAGDALAGALAAALDRGAPWPRALREGLAAGSLACTRPGAQAALPWRDEITALADTI
jgi:ribokinase